jgi:predicted permease
MRMLRALWKRFAAFVFREKDDDIDTELESHVAMHTEDGIRAGLSPEEARRQALIRLGGVEQTRQAYRERRGLPWLESLARDFIYSVRRLRKHSAVTAIAVLSIGLGVGANATIFSMVSRFVLRPAPVGDPSTLIALHILHDGNRCCNNFPFPVFADIRDQAKSLTSVAAYYPLIPASIGGSGEPERVWGQGVTSNFFDVTGIRMVVGRGFINGQETATEVVLSAGLWERRFNSDAEIVGKPVKLSGRTFTVVGIAPANFHSIDQILNSEFWVPLSQAVQLAAGAPPLSSREHHWLEVVGRVRSGATNGQVTAELNTLSQRFAQGYPSTDKGNRIIFDQAGSMPPKQRSAVLIFLAALTVVVVLVLVMAGANVAGLLFVQACGCQRDMAVRLALGATRGRLRRQMLMESALLGLGGGGLGILLSLWATRALSALHLPVPVPVNLRIDLDWRVLLFTFTLSVLSGLLLGLGPAWAASHPKLANALKGEDVLIRPGRRLSLRNLLVVVQIAMSLILLCITGLFLRSLQSAANIDIGFSPKNLLVMSIDPRVHGYSAQRTEQFLAQLQQRVAALPGVAAAAWTDVAPLSGGDRSDGFHVEGAAGKNRSQTNAALFMVAPGYFETMGIRLLAGRDFRNDTANSPRTAIVNRAFVEQILGGGNPLGQHVSGGGVTYEVIGVADNVKARTLGEDLRPVLYRSLVQSIADDPSQMGYTLVVRAAGAPSTLMEPVRRQIHLLDPTMAVYNEETMEDHVRTAYFLPHLAATLFGTFGCIGLVLAIVGLYGVMSYAVSLRTREIGIRMALGAEPGTVERLVLRQGLALTLVAIALGWPAAWMLSKLAASFLYGIQPHDAFTFATVPPVLFAIALVACWIPARRAASIDPMQALRTE